MKLFIQKLVKFLAYSAAALLILLAVFVGLFRLFLPRLPEYQEELKGWASDTIGMQVEFSGMNARWGLSGPELEFYDTELIRLDDSRRAIAAERVSIGISVMSLVFDQKFEVDRILIGDTSIEIRQLESGRFWVQGTPVPETPWARMDAPGRVGDMEIVGEDIEVQFLQPGDERPRYFRIPSALVSLDENRIAADLTIRLPEDLGREIDISATQLLGAPAEERLWDISLEADDVLLAGWSALHDSGDVRLLSGEGDVDLSLSLGRNGVRNAVADAQLDSVSLVAGQSFDLTGRFEFDLSGDGWLAAADKFRIATTDHQWPESSVRAEASVDADGKIVMLDVRANYLNLNDVDLLLPLLGEEQRTRLDESGLSGEVRDLIATVSDLDSDVVQYAVTAELDDFGFASSGKRPGLRGFTGQVRADRSGGRLEIESDDVLLELPEILDEPVDISTAAGTVLWRASDDRITVLSDSIRITNPVIDTRINVQLTLNADGSSPDIDLASSYTVSDVGAARRYLPRKVMTPRLYDWFQNSLVAGSIQRGTVRLNGPLDKFPFDGGEGRFLLEGFARNLTFRYHPDWPAADQADMDIVLDNTRLYSVRNRSMNAGSQSVNANIEIADLRQPVLTIDALITGTLDTFKQFILQSPIDNFTGGNLSRMTVSGDASFQLDMVVPIKQAEEATVNGLLRSNNGSLSIEGLNAPVTDLIGEVQITRDEIKGDSLGAQFLGEEVELRIGPSQDPAYFAVMTGTGAATATAIVEELGVPLAGRIEGSAPYETRVFFPRGDYETPQPLTVRIASPLRGIALSAPEPVGKSADESMLIRGDIRFIEGGERIESEGLADNGIAWQLAFTKPEGEWDLDRGVLMSGGGVIEPAETRGLHVRGRTTTVRLDDWLNLSRGDEQTVGAAEWIRSIDLVVDDLFLVGQHLEDHHLRVDRSARDWLVQFDGDKVVGSVFVPYDFDSDRAMVVEMERMHLPGDDVSPPEEVVVDPRTLPPIQLTAADFALGERYFGEVEINLARTEDGFESETMIATDDSFEFVGSGTWVADEDEELGSRTYVTASLNSTEVGATLQQLDLAEGVTGESMGVVLDISFGGGPRGDFFDALDGEVRMQLENGQLEEVEPGAGRMVGLMSIVALPRRLSLDFSDVFNRGFGYDMISGTFNIVDGIASTCDMSMESPAANIGIVGRVNLPDLSYEQGAVISAQVGNTLPIVGAVVGGPPGAAAMLIFSQLFRKPLEEVGQVYYSITGPWEELAVESANSDEFVQYGELAGCLAADLEQE